jgi:hypothetical protein
MLIRHPWAACLVLARASFGNGWELRVITTRNSTDTPMKQKRQ